MAEQAALAFAQSLRWILAGVAGAAFSKFDLLDRGFWYTLGFLGPTILALTAVDYLIRILILP